VPDISAFEKILPLLTESGGLTIPIDSIHDFSESGVRAAFERLDEGRARGKVVIKVKGD
jgi:NADPH:quinone reductase-like Zn-dependent oxidoreductase